VAHVAPGIGRRTRDPAWLAVPLLAFALVSLTVGLVARSTEPGPKHYFQLVFSDPIHMKVWLATAAATLAVFQIFSAAWIFRKLPWSRPPWINAAHRWSGRTAFVLTLPVAYHCIFNLGFQDATSRTLAHSLLGCAFFGAFAAKVLIVRLHRYPSWVLPTAGGLLFGILIAVWYTSALWFFRLVGVGL
jgi:Family of unknown function (DUF6529)